ncbi:MAG TPA: L-aspartate oxidase [Firmicutes bacterium]|nr:L-aspartate oxidase [Bacillota bacterium]
MATRYLMGFDLASLNKQATDFLVIGSGVAGLFAAIKASRYGRVLLLTKELMEGNTRYAQGGIAAAIGPDDSWQEHLADTLAAGAGLCDEEAVAILVREAPARIQELIDLGAQFDKHQQQIALTREGGHRRRRILHAGGDATGLEIERVLAMAALTNANIQVVDATSAVDLLTDQGQCYGALGLDRAGQLTAFLAKATILATGGAGQVYKYTTNSPVVTGDGLAMAYRAGAQLMDMEFFQFHPTALRLSGAPCALITEAVRGEGAHLLDVNGRRFMPAVHPLAELAPRNVVARAIVQAMEATASEHVWLDMRPIKGVDLPTRFPTVFKTCQKYGLDIRHDLIPVAPVAHYFMGGIRVDYHGRTNIDGLYACGETACLGLHGANRLASNSLLEGLVFGHRIAEGAQRNHLGISEQSLLQLKLSAPEPTGLTKPTTDIMELRGTIQQVMWQEVGLKRNRAGLMRAQKDLERVGEQLAGPVVYPEHLETINLHTVGQLICRAALMRTESRGGHFREDHPEQHDADWLRHIVLQGDSWTLVEQ